MTCQSSDIEGTVKGKINCQDLLSLKATAKLDGDIITKKLAIEPGAEFTGNCNMGGGGAIKEPEPVRLSTSSERSGGSGSSSGPNAITRPEPVKASH